MIMSVVPAGTHAATGPVILLVGVLADPRGRDPHRQGRVDRNRSRSLRRIVGVGDAAREG